MPARLRSPAPSLPDLHVGFFIAGMATTLLGPVLPALAQRWQVSDALVGLAFTVQFLGTVSMSALSSALVFRFGGVAVMIAGFVVLAIGIGGLTVAPWLPGLAAILCYGCGLGLVLPTTNVLVAAARPGREASAVSLVNVSWSGGAVAWPVMVASLGGGERIAVPLFTLAIVAGGIAVRLAFASGALVSAPLRAAGAGRGREPSTEPLPTGAAAQDARGVTALFLTFGALLFFYAGGEAAIGGWVAEHVRRMGGADSGRAWTFAPMAFWAALALGRLMTPLVLRVSGEPRVLVGALLVVLAASGALAVAPSVPIAFVAAVLAGFGLAPVFPITFVDLSRTLAPVRPRAVGPAYAMASVGSAVLPWLVGFCSTELGSLRAGLVVPVVSTVAMLALTAVRLSRQHRTRFAQEGDAITQTPQ
jgi:MFS transporter, FHS family, glucose/mannose:H+ symporter